MKKIGIAFLLLIAMFPLVAGDNISLSIPEDFQGMWRSSDVNMELMEISNDNVYIYGVSIFDILETSALLILDIDTRENQNGFTITIEANGYEQTGVFNFIFALENKDSLIFCWSDFLEEENAFPYGEIFTYSRIK